MLAGLLTLLLSFISFTLPLSLYETMGSRGSGKSDDNERVGTHFVHL